MPRKYVRKTDNNRAENTNLYVYGSAENQIFQLATKVDEVNEFVRDLKGGEHFAIEARKFDGEWNPEIIFVPFTVEKIYPNYVSCIGPTGRRQGFTFQDVYFAMHNKSFKRLTGER